MLLLSRTGPGKGDYELKKDAPIVIFLLAIGVVIFLYIKSITEDVGRKEINEVALTKSQESIDSYLSKLPIIEEAEYNYEV